MALGFGSGGSVRDRGRSCRFAADRADRELGLKHPPYTHNAESQKEQDGHDQRGLDESLSRLAARGNSRLVHVEPPTPGRKISFATTARARSGSNASPTQGKMVRSLPSASTTTTCPSS